MNNQTSLDFSPHNVLSGIVHRRENNSHSESILKEQTPRLTKNCQILHDALLRGEILSGMVIMSKYKMCEYRKRIQELKKVLTIKERVLSNGAKEWYL